MSNRNTVRVLCIVMGVYWGYAASGFEVTEELYLLGTDPFELTNQAGNMVEEGAVAFQPPREQESMKPGWITMGVAGLVMATRLVCAGEPGTPPHILLIISDDQAWTDYSFMGHPDIRTPHIDKPAESGVTFRRGSVATPLCRPSLMNLATGQYGHRNGVTGNDPSPARYNTSPEAYGAARAAVIAKIDAFDTLPEKRSRSSFQVDRRLVSPLPKKGEPMIPTTYHNRWAFSHPQRSSFASFACPESG